VTAVSAFTSSAGHPGIETEDAATAALRFEGGAVGVIYGTTSSWPGQAKRLEITGVNGTAVLVEDRLAVFAFRDKRPEDAEALKRFGKAGDAYGVSNPASITPELHAACFSDFLEAVETGRPFQVDGTSARKSVALIRAIYESAASGRQVRL
jgi:predicted dehydrogenase